MNQNSKINSLLEIMLRLRDPEHGCPWDLQQSFETVAPYTIEEAYEVDDAIRRKDFAELKEELGDLLLQVVFHSRMAEEAGLFDFNDVCNSICEKMLARHPHVFGDRACSGKDSVDKVWEEKKQAERRAKNQLSALDGVALALPALMRAQKLQKRAARIGFDWPSIEPVIEKIDEEMAELTAARSEENEEQVHEEFGDLLFAVVNLGRKLGIDTETSLRDASNKFERRFRGVESQVKISELSGDQAADLEYMEQLWANEKNREK